MQLFITFDPGFLFFLGKNPAGLSQAYELRRRASVKDIIESLGIPHTEIGWIRYEGESVDFAFIPERGGRLEVGGIDAPFNVHEKSRLRPHSLDQIRFVADVNVIRLGKLLILLGFDVFYARDLTDAQIAQISAVQDRIVLTRDTRLLNRRQIRFAKRIRENDPYKQLAEVVDFFGLAGQIRFFSRCMQCNKKLISVSKEKILSRLEPRTRKYFNTFLQCPCCKKIYWKGSHFDHIRGRLKRTGFDL